MATVGIIANPISGKDIRRLIAHGSVFDNQEKVRIVRRVLMGLAAIGIEDVVYMPDEYAIVPRAIRGCKIPMEPQAIPIRIENNQTDSIRAGAWMDSNGVDCLVVLGGDGTCRAVAKGSVRVPVLPISTGTNNVFPFMMEATVAGISAGLIAQERVPLEAGAFRSSLLEVVRDEEEVVDIALVDVAVYNDRFIAARAIWDMSKVSQIYLTRSRPEAIGLSSIGGQLVTIEPEELRGLHLTLGNGGKRVLAPIAPGLLESVSIAKSELMRVGDSIPVVGSPCVLALDGEREVEVRSHQAVSVRLSDKGPYVVDPRRTMAYAQAHKLLVR